MIALAAVAAGIVLGWLSGGALRGLETVQLRFEWLVLLLFVVQAVARGRIAGLSASRLGLGVWVFSCVALVVTLVPDWRRPGIWLIAIGLSLNLFVVLLNGGMPVSLPSGSSVGESAVSVSRSLGFYQLAGPGTVAGMLGDTVQLVVAASRALLSPGDVLLSLGVVTVIVDAMLSLPAIESE